jgi:hypothetical protein
VAGVVRVDPVAQSQGRLHDHRADRVAQDRIGEHRVEVDQPVHQLDAFRAQPLVVLEALGLDELIVPEVGDRAHGRRDHLDSARVRAFDELADSLFDVGGIRRQARRQRGRSQVVDSIGKDEVGRLRGVEVLCTWTEETRYPLVSVVVPTGMSALRVASPPANTAVIVREPGYCVSAAGGDIARPRTWLRGEVKGHGSVTARAKRQSRSAASPQWGDFDG